mmetsp:Transcript_117631/g.228679  ORF Transcript_117631/g.228679 Transcript_117631/m.228679 type:complete len:342 (-) Transcript_117631:71-1096(-)
MTASSHPPLARRTTYSGIATIEERLEKMEQLHQKVDKAQQYQEGYQRKRATALLFYGSIFGLMGFAFAFATGLMKTLNTQDKYDSGYGYFSATVSEMVFDPRDAAGKAFFGFEFIGANFIFLSWYPWSLRNVFLGDDEIAFCSISWVMLRQLIPAPGMMLVATVTTTPIALARPRDIVTIAIHFSGAMMMFVGYVIIEGKTLGWRCFTHPIGGSKIDDVERKWRTFFVDGVCFWYIMFFAVQIVLGAAGGVGGSASRLPICCADTYSTPAGPHETEKLVNTASGIFLVLKVVSYASEVLCGINLIMSHLTVWYYCKERHIDLEDELVEMGGEQYKALPDTA